MSLGVFYEGARREDDGALRAFLHRSPSGGDVRLRIEKEPGFFDAFEVEGERGDVLLARDEVRREIVGVGARAEKACFVNGRPAPTGYLSTLRIDPAFRGGKVLKAGYLKMREMHDAGTAKLYTTTIMSGNVPAVRALTQGRPGLPLYRDFGGYATHIYGAARNPWGRPADIGRVRPASGGDLPALAEFWRRVGSARQFFPVYEAGHLAEAGGLLRGLSPEEVLVLEIDGRIVGTAALWNQMGFRQWIIDGYSTRAGLLRPAWNAFARLTGRPRFPAAGRALDYRFLALFVIEGDSRGVAERLLHALWQKAATEAPDGLIVAGIHERDPLASLLARPPSVRFDSRLFVVHWEDGREAFESLDDRVPYLEAGSL